MFCTIWFLIDRDDWWLELVEVLVGVEESTILNLPTENIFQSAMCALIVDVYVQSVSGMLLPPHGCWVHNTYLYNVQYGIIAAFEYVFLHILLCWLDSHTKKNYQGNNNCNRGPLDMYQVYHDIQNTAGCWWWNTRLYFSHANINSIIVCILPRWNVAIHTVSWKLDIVNLTDGLFIQSL